MKKISIVDDNGYRKEIGEIDYDTFYKRVVEKIHLFQKSDAWGMDYNALIMEVAPVCKFISIYEIDTQTVYVATIKHFLKKGFTMKFGGHKKQWFMQRKHFSPDKISAEKAYADMLIEEEKLEKIKNSQTSLFD